MNKMIQDRERERICMKDGYATGCGVEERHFEHG
jgi:hypothetical protein